MSKKVNNIEIKKIGGLYALRRDRKAKKKHVVIWSNNGNFIPSTCVNLFIKSLYFYKL